MTFSKTSTTIAMVTSVALAGFAGLAQAQTPPVPPAPPAAPVVVPAPAGRPTPQGVPMPAPAPRAPRRFDLDPLLVDLDQLRVNLDDFKVALPALAPLPPMPMIDVQLLQEATREATREAMDRARLAWDDARLDWQQNSMVYTYNRSSGDYSAGKDLVNQKKYEPAIARFDRVIAQKGSNVDGALYWKAYSQYKLGKTDDAIATIAVLRKDHASSPYMQDAKVLDADARRMTGKPVNPADADDEELKILAIQGLIRQDAARGVDAAEIQLNKTNSLRFKKQLLYLLASSEVPKAYQVLLNFAKGGGNPDLQLEAIQYLAANRNKQATSADLMAIYQSTQSTDVKLAIISALRASGNQMALTQIVSSGSTPVPIRSSALSGLAGVMSPQDLWTLYEKETDKELKLQMVSVFGSMQAIDQLSRVVKTEKDLEVRRRALRALGNMKSDKTGQMLVDLYGAEQDVESKKSIISSLGNQNNAEGLVAIARKESSLALKTDIVRKLSEMAPRNKVAADYLMEIIK